jgi:aminoglycoside 6-adenylyltransferase
MDALLERFVDWAGRRDDIRAAIVVGSRARRDVPHDEFSDLDIPFFCTEPAKYTMRKDWLSDIGAPVVSFREPTSDGNNFEHRVLFEPDLDVDFVPLPAGDLNRLAAMEPEVAGRWLAGKPGLTRGCLVVLDKDGIMPILVGLPTARGPTPPPTADEYAETVNGFLYRALWTARKLRRGELWTAKESLDVGMKRLGLLPMLEWHAMAVFGDDHDTWHDGRFLEKWAEPSAAKRLPGTFARYDSADIGRALHSSMDLFRDLAAVVSERNGFEYPTSADTRIRDLVDRTLESPRAKF